MNPASFIGKKIAERYEILSIAGVGGMGAVYKARQDDLGRLVAIKLLDPEGSDEDSIKRFKREAKSLARLSHLHIAAFYSYGILEEVQSIPYIVMEFLDGENLGAALATAEGGYLPELRVIDIALQVSEALAYAHANNVIHRDLKPGNIILQNSSQADFVKLVDFGLSYLSSQGESSQHLTKTGQLVGTPQYLSPEQCMGLKADARSDVYALGCILFEMLSGSTPFASENAMSLIHAHVSEKAPTLSRKARQKISAGLNEIVMACLFKQADLRYQNMNDLHNDLLLLKHGKQPKIAKNEGSPGQTLLKLLKNQAIIRTTAAVCVFATMAFAYAEYLKNSNIEFRCAKALGAKPDETRIKQWLEMVEKLSERGARKDAQSLLNCIRKTISKSQLDPETKLRMQIKIAESLFQRHEYAASRTFVISAIETVPRISKTAKTYVTRDALLKATSSYLRKLKLQQDKTDSTKEELNKLDESKKLNELVSMHCLLALGNLFIADFEKAIAHTESAAPLVNQLHKIKRLSLDTIAAVQMIIDAYDGAHWSEFEFLQKHKIRINTQLSAWNLIRAAHLTQNEDGTDSLKRLLNVARGYIALADWKNALKMLEIILSEKTLATPEATMELRFRRAAVLEHLGNFTSMQNLEKEQSKIVGSLPRQMQIINAELWAANYQTALTQLDKAMKTWQRESPDSLDEKISILRTYADVWGDQGDYKNEEKYLRLAMAELKKVPQGSTKYTLAYMQVLKALVSCLETQRRYAEADELEVSSNLARKETMKNQDRIMNYPNQEGRISP